MQPLNQSLLKDILSTLLLAEVPPVVVSKLNSDTRSLKVGDTFVALSGEQFDGHVFAEQALDKGASVLIVEKALPLDVPQIIVKDTRLALGKIAAYIRNEFQGKVVGLTGSVGKTTNKQMLASILSQRGKTHMTKGNLNNDLGVPFTWFELPAEAQFAVIEMGANHQGEIDYLASITRPDVAMITNAGEAHLEGFGGLEGVAKGKGELFKRLDFGDVAVLNLDDKYADYWRGLLSDGVVVKTFALHNHEADVYAEQISADGAQFVLSAGHEKINIQLPTVGHHNVMNALGCVACAVALGLSIQEIASGLSLFETEKGRLQKYQWGNLTLIDDTYNANPMSMRASANIIAQNDGKRLMVIGDMGELGTDELELHAQLGLDLQNKAEHFYCLGERMKAFVKTNKVASHFDHIDGLNLDLITKVKSLLANNSQVTILVKGSRSMQMERVVDVLLKTFNNQQPVKENRANILINTSMNKSRST